MLIIPLPSRGEFGHAVHSSGPLAQVLIAKKMFTRIWFSVLDAALSAWLTKSLVGALRGTNLEYDIFFLLQSDSGDNDLFV
jgi:hypothetical protein